MKFLADMGISSRTVTTLRDRGHDAVHVRDVGLARATDEAILERARLEVRVVLTVDLDSGQLLATGRHKNPSVVIFRVRDQTPASVTPRLLRVIAERSAELDQGVIIIIEDRRYRVRRLPIAR